MILQISNGARVATEAIGTYPLWLSSDFRLILKDCYYIPVASQNLIFISVLAQEDFIFNFNKDFCSIYLRNKLVACYLLIDNLYHLHVDACVNINEQIVGSAVGHKQFRDDVNHKYMWHLKLDHIGEDRINKLEKNDLLGFFNSESI